MFTYGARSKQSSRKNNGFVVFVVLKTTYPFDLLLCFSLHAIRYTIAIDYVNYTDKIKLRNDIKLI